MSMVLSLTAFRAARAWDSFAWQSKSVLKLLCTFVLKTICREVLTDRSLLHVRAWCLAKVNYLIKERALINRVLIALRLTSF